MIDGMETKMETFAAPAQGTQMIDRTVSLMRLVATYCPKGARLTDLAEESGLSAPTARRILKRLVAHGLIDQDMVQHRYRLGRLAVEFGLSAHPVRTLGARYRPMIEEISLATGDTIYLLMRSGLDSICIDRVDAGHAEKRPTIQVGDRLPLGVGVGGMALLGALPIDEAERVIAANRPIYRRFVRTTGSSFRDHLVAARSEGQIIRRSPVTPGIVGFGMVLPEPGGTPTLAISGATAAVNFSEPRRTAMLELMHAIVTRHIGAACKEMPARVVQAA
jgi:DNA-binding IclR family transcriptional regulator